MRNFRKIRFHIIHNYTSANKGWAAIVISTVNSLRSVIPNAAFTIESYDPARDAKLYGAYNIIVLPKIVRSKLKSLFLLLEAMLFRIFLEAGLPTTIFSGFQELAFYNNCDVVLDLSGDCLSVPTHNRSIRFRLQRSLIAIAGDAYLLLLLMFLKKPIIIYAQTIGPIGVLEPLIIPFLQKTSLITVREENSFKYLIGKGIKQNKIFLTADPAFLLPTPNNESVKEVLCKEGIRLNKPIIGMCISSETLNYHLPDSRWRSKIFFADIIDILIEKYDVQVVLFPFSTWSGHGGDDRICSQEIADLVKNKNRVKVIKGDYDPITLKGMIAYCEMFIGMRGHSCILALSSCVPTIAIGHNPKYWGIMKMLGQEQYTCEVTELTLEKFLSLVEHLWNDRYGIKRTLEMRLKEVYNLARINAEIVCGLLKDLKII